MAELQETPPVLLPAGWHGDPLSPQRERWWSGIEWTGHVRERTVERTPQQLQPRRPADTELPSEADPAQPSTTSPPNADSHDEAAVDAPLPASAPSHLLSQPPAPGIAAPIAMETPEVPRPPSGAAYAGVSLGLGVLACLTFFLPIVATVIGGVAIWLGLVGRARARRIGASRALARWGLVMGAIGTCLNLMMTAFVIVTVASQNGALS